MNLQSLTLKFRPHCGRTEASWAAVYTVAAAGPLIVTRATASVIIWSFIFFSVEEE